MEKHINYLSRDFESIKEELIKFSNQYYPELSDDFNDSSVGAWFIDLVSAVGDDLSTIRIDNFRKLTSTAQILRAHCLILLGLMG